MTSQHDGEIKQRTRFGFGRNWKRFLSVLTEENIREATRSLQRMLRTDSLSGKSFLDIGSGSGLFSLSARQLGARVHSFDYDPESVACTRELKSRYFPDDPNWVVEQGSVLDENYLARGKFDIVYSWGVLHHTGQMFKAFENVTQTVTSGGLLFIAIYNDQGWVSRYWTFIKRIYNKGRIFGFLVVVIHLPYLLVLRYIIRALSGRLALERGMSLWHDMIDWLGGYPFEVAKPESVFRFFRDHGFVLEELRTCGGRMGCNEFVFKLASGLTIPSTQTGDFPEKIQNPVGHLERIREAEWGIVQSLLPRRARVLEIGGGSGFQASLMIGDGFDVVSLDTSPNAGAIQYAKVLSYDGVNLPFECEAFDVVYSSNALEHIERLEDLLVEMKRVLKPEGFMLHLVPSASWRFWTTLAHYPFLVKYVISLGRGVTMGPARTTISGTLRAKGWPHFIWRTVFSGPHGQDANALVELVRFSKWYWVRRFLRAGWHIVSVRDTSLFYTGYELAPWLPLWGRLALGRILGGACHVFVLSKEVRNGSSDTLLTKRRS